MAIVLMIAGILVISYGVNHMNSTGSKVANFFGKEDSNGIIAMVVGLLLTVFGTVLLIGKKD